MKESKPRRRWLRRTLFWGGAGIVALAILVALLPLFIGWGLFQGVIRDAIGASFEGDVEVDGLSVSWLGDQEIEQLSITGPDGDASAQLAVRLERGLLPLVLGSTDYGTLHLAGALEGVRYADGSTSLAKLLKEKEETEPLDMKVRIISGGIDVSLRDVSTDEVLAVRALEGEVLFDPKGTTEIDVEALTSVGGQPGGLHAKGSIERLYDEAGFIDARGARFDLAAEVSHLPVAVLDGLLGMQGRLSALAGEAVQQATIHFEGDFQDGHAAASLESTQLSLTSAVALVGGALVIESAEPMDISLRLPAAAVSKLLGGGDDPMIAIAEGGEASTRILVTSAHIPLFTEGGLDLSGAAITASLQSADVPVLARSGDSFERIDIESLSASIESADVTRGVAVVINGSAIAEGRSASTLSGQFNLTNPMASDGRVTLDPSNIEGRLEALNAPTSLAQGLLGDSPIMLARDLGPQADITAVFSAGESRTVELTLASEHANALVRALIGADGAVAGESATLSFDLQPELVAEFAPRGFAIPRQLSAQLSTFTIPARGEGEPFSIAKAGVEGTLELVGESIGPASADQDASIGIDSVAISFAAPALRESFSLNGTILSRGAEIEIDEVIRDLFGSDGSLQPLDATPIGTISVRGITAEHIGALAPELAGKLASAVGGGIEAIVTTREQSGSGMLVAEVEVTSSELDAALAASRDGDAITLISLDAHAAVSPELVRAWQPDAEEPIEATADEITIALMAPTPLLVRTATGYATSLDAIELSLHSPQIIVSSAPGLARAVAVSELASDIRATLGEASRVDVRGSATLHRLDQGGAGATSDAGEGQLADATFTASILFGPDDSTGRFPALSLALAEIDIAIVESVLEREAGSLAKFLGPAGELSVDVEPTNAGFEATLVPVFPYLSGTFHAVRDETTIALDAENATVILSAAALGEFLSPPSDAPAGQPRIAAGSDVPLRVDLNSFSLPAAILSGEALSSTGAAIDIAIAIRQPLELSRTLATRGVETAQFDELSLAVTGDDLDDGISLSLNGLLRSAAAAVGAGSSPPPGEGEADPPPSPGTSRSRIEIAATLSDLVNEALLLDIPNATLTAEARIRRTPAWVADAAAGTGTMLGDALGAAITAELNAENFSPNSGTLTANIGGENQSRIRAKLTGRDGGYAAERGDPITGALTLSPELRNRLLHGIHPIFSDVRALNEQVRFKVRNAFIPAAASSPDSPGATESSIDLSRLSGVIELTIGAAEFTAGSEFLRILQFVDTAQGTGSSQPQAEGRTIEGYIGPLDGSPIIIKVENGRLTYENFIIHLEREQVEEETGRGGRDRRNRDRATDPQAPPAEAEAAQEPVAPMYAHRLLFSGDVDLANKSVTRIVGAYPLADLASMLRRGAPGGLPDIATVGVRFFGDLFDSAGNPLDLQMEIDFNLQIENIFEEGLKRIPAEDAPGLQRLLEEIFK